MQTSLTGIQADPEILAFYKKITLEKCYKWATFKIGDMERIIIDYKAEACTTDTKEEDCVEFDQLVATLDDEPRYILYDFGFTNEEGRKIQKLAFIFW